MCQYLSDNLSLFLSPRLCDVPHLNPSLSLSHTHTHTHALSPTFSITHIHTHARTHTCTHTHERRHTCRYTHTHTRTHERARARTHTHTHTRTHERTHERTHICIHTHERARAHTRTHTHISNTHIYEYIPAAKSGPRPQTPTPIPVFATKPIACQCPHTANPILMKLITSFVDPHAMLRLSASTDTADCMHAGRGIKIRNRTTQKTTSLCRGTFPSSSKN